MSKIGVTAGTIAALSLVATVFYYQPSRASDALLAKAQSEFTAKARDAVLQRRAQAMRGPVLASVPRSEPAQTHIMASPAPAPAEPSEARSIPARPPTAPVQVETVPAQAAATADVVEAPTMVAKLPDVAPPVSSDAKVEEIRPESKPLADSKLLATETAVQNIETPKLPDVPKAAAPQAVTPTPRMSRTTLVAPGKIQKATPELSRTVQARKMSVAARRFQRDFGGGRIPYNVEALRARAPEIAAAIARYM